MYIFRTTNVEIENHKAGIKFKISTNETIWIFKLSDEEHIRDLGKRRPRGPVFER
jgi:hypothetical protein